MCRLIRNFVVARGSFQILRGHAQMITLKDDNSVFHSAFKIYRSLTIHKDVCHKFSHMEGILRNGEA